MCQRHTLTTSHKRNSEWIAKQKTCFVACSGAFRGNKEIIECIEYLVPVFPVNGIQARRQGSKSCRHRRAICFHESNHTLLPEKRGYASRNRVARASSCRQYIVKLTSVSMLAVTSFSFYLQPFVPGSRDRQPITAHKYQQHRSAPS